jgi:cobalt-zinc-cadmium efflux system membrane fusion protein
MISLGENVTKDDAMFEVSCRKNLWLELDVFEKDILTIQKGQRVTFLLANAGNEIYEASVSTSGGAVLGTGRVVKVLATFKNDGQQLIPGMFVAAKIHTGEKEFSALPESAIMNMGTSNTYIYYTLEKEGSEKYTFKKLPVSTGYNEDGFVQVSFPDPLPGQARVVVNGGYYILAEEGGE